MSESHAARVRVLLAKGVRRMWARVDTISGSTAFATTQDGDRVLIARCLKDIEDIRIGDFISFFPEPVTSDGTARYFALNPSIVAWAMEGDEPETTSAHAPQHVAEQIQQGAPK